MNTELHNRFNAARSIVCVETEMQREQKLENVLFQCRTQHCVCRDFAMLLALAVIICFNAARSIVCVETSICQLFFLHTICFNAARSIVCVETTHECLRSRLSCKFQCRTQHCVCRDHTMTMLSPMTLQFQYRTQHCVCRDGKLMPLSVKCFRVSIPHAALCVSRWLGTRQKLSLDSVSIPHAALCVSR